MSSMNTLHDKELESKLQRRDIIDPHEKIDLTTCADEEDGIKQTNKQTNTENE